MTIEMRKAEILVNDEWIEVPFLKIKEGDIYRLFEATGEQVLDSDANGVFIAECDAYIDDSTGIGVVRDRPFGKSK